MFPPVAEVEKMRYLFLLAILGLMGCQGVIGPLEYRQPKRVDDPFLPIYEQQKNGRDQLPLPDETYLPGPNVGILPNNAFSK
jgi:hypothetical protein